MLDHGRGRADLRADCESCFGLCCVAPAFAASAHFAIDKDAGRPCPNLQADFRCGIHRHLRQRGFLGCAVYDCFGAGQKVARLTFQSVPYFVAAYSGGPGSGSIPRTTSECGHSLLSEHDPA